MKRLWNIFALFIFVLTPIIILCFLPKQIEPIKLLTAALVGITAYYAYTTRGQLEQAKESTISAIRPLIIATRLSQEGEIGAFAGEEGLNRIAHLINVGSGHAHRVNIRLSPPTKAYARAGDSVREEGSIYVIQGVEMPINSKRMWNSLGAFCSRDNWHYMYAEYEDMEGNQYYTVQSGYNVKTGRIKELKQKIRKNDNDAFWVNQEQENWLENIDVTLKDWTQQQKEIFERRTARN